MADAAHIGVLAVEPYFPATFVCQTELEQYDKCSAGKYTLGLGQSQMACLGDNEDVQSICMTAVQNLMERTNTPFERIGFLQVGTETLIDASKSVKASLMQLFEESGNFDVEGVDNTNACYGGTAALLNAFAWLESSACNGRLALVVAGDIAVYEPGPARPTGGAGAVALLLGPHAPLVMEPHRASYMSHAYDFYKPDLGCEYPVVDGPLSVSCYLTALDSCSSSLTRKLQTSSNSDIRLLDTVDYCVFHSPYNKLVQKAFGRLVLHHTMSTTKSTQQTQEEVKEFTVLHSYKESASAVSVSDYNTSMLSKDAVAAAGPRYQRMVLPATHFQTHVGNTYTASLYMGLVSLLSDPSISSLEGRRALLFSYGSGLAASMFVLRGVGDTSQMTRGVRERLASRVKVSPSLYTTLLDWREARSKDRRAAYTPTVPTAYLFPGTYYLAAVDDKCRRTYARYPLTSPSPVNPLPNLPPPPISKVIATTTTTTTASPAAAAAAAAAATVLTSSTTTTTTTTTPAAAAAAAASPASTTTTASAVTSAVPAVTTSAVAAPLSATTTPAASPALGPTGVTAPSPTLSSSSSPHTTSPLLVAAGPGKVPVDGAAYSTTQDHLLMWSGFFKKTVAARQAQVGRVFPHLGTSPVAASTGGLPTRVADVMVENCIGVLGVPLGLGLHFVVNEQFHVVPMAVEEPSVIAAASAAARLVASGGGFRSAASPAVMTGQIYVVDLPRSDVAAAAEAIASHKASLIAEGNTFCASMARRGGGVVDIEPRVVDSSGDPQGDLQCDRTLVLHVYVDVCQAMGANVVNTVVEGLAPAVEQITHGRVALRVLSNLPLRRIVRSRFCIPVSSLARPGVDGVEVAKRIIQATDLATLDAFRAVTHNKGVMNGVDAVALAVGQDWRAIEAAAHAFAIYKSARGAYEPLTRYWLSPSELTGSPTLDGLGCHSHNATPTNNTRATATAADHQGDRPVSTSAAHSNSDNNTNSSASNTTGGFIPSSSSTSATTTTTTPATASATTGSVTGVSTTTTATTSTTTASENGLYLCGELTLPMPVGVVGGPLKTHPAFAYTHGLLGSPDAASLSQIIVSVGLASNLAAVRALVTEGIQRGHMALHARNIAVAAGTPPALVSEVAAYLASAGTIDTTTARRYLEAHELYSNVSNYSVGTTPSAPLVLSTLTVEVAVPDVAEPITVNVVVQRLYSTQPLHLFLCPSSGLGHPLQQELFGDKGHQWLLSIFSILGQLHLRRPSQPRATATLQHRLKLLSVLASALCSRLLVLYPRETLEFLQDAFVDCVGEDKLFDSVHSDYAPALCLGLPLLMELHRTFGYLLEQHENGQNATLTSALMHEHTEVLRSMAIAQKWKQGISSPTDFASFYAVVSKRWQATVMLLCDAVTVKPRLLTDAVIEVICLMGRRLEYYGSAVHDCARRERDARDATPNSYVFWSLLHTNVEPTQERFFQLCAEVVRARSPLRPTTTPEASEVFDPDFFRNTFPIIRQYYGYGPENLAPAPLECL